MKRGRLKLVAVVSSALLIFGCAGDTAYRIASFLFDGVPAPDAGDQEILDDLPADAEAASHTVPGSEETTVTDLKVEANLVRHAPFAAGNCTSCHDAGNSNQQLLAGNDLCLSCHNGVLTGKEVVHIVALIDCLICHDPHRAAEESLLYLPVVDLCLECHVRKDVEEGHGQILDCMLCHNPHESDTAALLDFE